MNSMSLCAKLLSFLTSGGTVAQSTYRGRRWAEEGAQAPWTSWRILPGPTTPEDVGPSLQSGSTSGITALPDVSTEMRMMDGIAAAPHLYHRREGTRGTVTAPPDHPKATHTTMPTSAVCWKAKRGGEEVLVGRTKTVTLPLRAAPEERAAIVTTAGLLATVQKRRTLCHHTLSGRPSATAGLSRLRTGTALQNLPGQSDTGPLNQPRGLSVTPGPTRGRPTHCRGAERRERETETWWVICSRNMDFLPLQLFRKEHLNPVSSYRMSLAVFCVVLIVDKYHEKCHLCSLM